MRAGVFFQHHVVLADRVRFLLRSQRHHRSGRRSSRPPRLLSRNRRLCSAPLTRRLLTPITPRPASRPTRLPGGPGRLPSSGRASSSRRPRPRPVCASGSRTLPRHRYVVPRIRLRRYVVILRIRRLLEGNRRTCAITPLPNPCSPARTSLPGVPPRVHRRLTTARLIPSPACSAPTRTRRRRHTSTPRTGPSLRATRTHTTRRRSHGRNPASRSTTGTATRTRTCSTRPEPARTGSTRARTTRGRTTPGSARTTRAETTRAGSTSAHAAHAGSTRAGTTGRTTDSRTIHSLYADPRTTGRRTTRDRATGSGTCSRPIGSATRARSTRDRAGSGTSGRPPAPAPVLGPPARTACAWATCLRAAWSGAGWLVCAACAGVGRGVDDGFDPAVQADGVDHRLPEDLVTAGTGEALPRPRVHQSQRQCLIVDGDDLRVLAQHDPREPPLALHRLEHLRPQPPNIRQPHRTTRRRPRAPTRRSTSRPRSTTDRLPSTSHSRRSRSSGLIAPRSGTPRTSCHRAGTGSGSAAINSTPAPCVSRPSAAPRRTGTPAASGTKCTTCRRATTGPRASCIPSGRRARGASSGRGDA